VADVLTKDEAIHFADDACLSLRGLAGDPSAAERVERLRDSHEALRADNERLRRGLEKIRTCTAYIGAFAFAGHLLDGCEFDGSAAKGGE